MALRLAILISGSGTTLQNFLDRIAAGRLPATVAVVISSKPGVRGLERAAAAGIPHLVVERKQCGSVEEFSAKIFAHCREAGAELACLAGFLQLIKIPDDYAGKVLNIHPALIPAFSGKGMYGHHVHEALLKMGVKLTGCTVHFADNEYDHGPIVLQRAVPVLDDDTPETVAARVFEQECEAYPEAVRLFALGRLRVEGGRVRIILSSEENSRNGQMPEETPQYPVEHWEPPPEVEATWRELDATSAWLNHLPLEVFDRYRGHWIAARDCQIAFSGRTCDELMDQLTEDDLGTVIIQHLPRGYIA